MTARVYVPPLTTEDICLSYEDGMSLRGLMQKYRISYGVVRRVLRDGNVAVRKPGGGWRKAQGKAT